MLESVTGLLAYPPIQRAVLACFLAGASCSLLSVFVVLMKLPLIGVSMSHAAFAGAVLGMLLGFNPFLSGFGLCLLVAAVLGPLSDRADLDPENALGIIFSFLMGIAFLGLGILTRTKASALNLMWGSLLTLSSADILILSLITAALIIFVLLFFKEIAAVLFNRRLAASSGVPERAIYYVLLFMTGAVVSSNLATVGGLLIFALLVQPGATALQLTYNLKHFFLIAMAAGIGACISGLILSYIFDLPSGASVVLMATSIFAGAYALSPKRRHTKKQ
ncbi:MAG: Manganese transport system membrane protein MntB [Deltaproteobacteria bacterium ADurb.Bin510]|nr:MAG: Manganese transport system membrane protein MntB [Deltaproteobacteria bacterium ADurb.Bin510]